MAMRISINEDFIDKLKEESGITEASQLVTEALSLLKWAISEAKDGRILVTTNNKGEIINKVSIPSLDAVLAKSSFNNNEQFVNIKDAVGEVGRSSQATDLDF
jgi:uncharacterized membrane protein